MFRTVLALATVGGITIFGHAAYGQEWQPKEFPISFWCAPPAEYISLERYQQVKQAGFNYLMPPCDPTTVTTNLKILDLAQASGLKVFVSDPRMPSSIAATPQAKENLDSIVHDYAGHPALAGYFITDEPTASAFAGLGEVVDYLRQKDPLHPGFINLLPNYATPEQLGTPGYEQYVEQFIQTVKPFVVCYDHYNFLTDGDRPEFFSNLEVVRRLSSKHGLPFWQIVLSIGHGGYREPNEAEKRYAAMQTLVYGAKGVLYFTYWTPSDSSYEWKPAIISQKGEPTAQYPQVQRITADVEAIGRVLLNARSEEVLAAAPDTTQTLSAPASSVESDEPARELQVTLSDLTSTATAGLFRSANEEYLLVASRNYKGETSGTLRLRANGSTLIERLEKPASSWVRILGSRQFDGTVEFTLRLAPGDAELYRWRTALK